MAASLRPGAVAIPAVAAAVLYANPLSRRNDVHHEDAFDVRNSFKTRERADDKKEPAQESFDSSSTS